MQPTFFQKHIIRLMGLCVCVGLMACGATAPNRKPNPIQEREKIILLNRNLSNYLKLVRDSKGLNGNGQLEVKVALENEEKKDVWTDIQVIFLGDDGFELEKTSWEPIMFHGRKITEIHKVSMGQEASDYKLLIRLVR